MRLIDADELLNAVEASRRNNPHKDPKVARSHNTEHQHFLWLIINQPTAFDAEAVKKQISEEGRAASYHVMEGDTDNYQLGKKVAFDRSLELVNRGGKEEAKA